MKTFTSVSIRLLALAGVAAVLVASAPDAAAQDRGRSRGHDRQRLHDRHEVRQEHSRAWLGVLLNEQTGGDGITVTSVVEDSPAAAAGLEDGDVIVSLNGVSIDGQSDFFDEFRRLEPGDDADIVVLRAGREVSLSPTLSERRGGDRAVFFPRLRNFRFGHDDHDGPEVRRRGYLGVQLQEMTPDLQEFFGAPEGQGVLISQIVADSPAAQAGLEVGDVIVEIDGEIVEGHSDLMRGVNDKREGDRVGIVVYRDGRPLNIDVISGEREHEVREWSRIFTCDDENPDCNMRFDFNFEGLEGIGDGLAEGLGNLHEVLNSDHFRNMMEGAYERSFQFQENMDEWREQLDQHLEELEERLHERHEDDGDGSRTSRSGTLRTAPSRI